jgi:hypothetical protein
MAGLTRSLQTIQLYVSKAHQQKPALHKQGPLWQACKLQTFFAENRLVRYFAIQERAGTPASLEGPDITRSRAALLEEELFKKLEKDPQEVKRDLEEQAIVVQDFGDSRAARIPWLERT